MKGTLTKNSEGVWMVKWYDWIFYGSSDLHSFAHGTHWMYTELVDNGHIDGLKLYDSNEGLEVEFEMVAGYDNNGPDHFPKFARILTPEEDELKDWDDDCFYNYQKEFKKLHYHTAQMSKEEFINRIKTDDEFAKKWGELGPNHFPTYAKTIEEAELKDWDVTLNDGLENEPYISDDFQIGPDGAYEHIEEWNILPKEKASELVDKFSNECLLTTDGGKVAALIAVDEIKRILYDQDSMTRYDYWFEVKKEINKL